MTTSTRTVLALLLLVPLLSACVEDDRTYPCSGPDLGLDGTWFGAMEDDLGTLFTMEWRICGSGIVGHRLSGTDFGLTGHLASEAPGVYRAYLSDGSDARLLTDPGRRYGVMVSDFFDFAVLQRGAQGLPHFHFTDLDGVWFGRQARQSGSNLVLIQSSLYCGSGLCSTQEADGFNASVDFAELDRDFGLFRGSYTASSGSRGIAGALMSADGEFLGSYFCPYGYNDPWQCRFGSQLRD